MRDAERIEAQITEHNPALRENSSEQQESNRLPRHLEEARERTAPFRWKPGQSGNPGGRPKKDWAAYIAQEVFENNPELIANGLLKSLSKGSGFVFQVAADRAYGKVPDKLNVSFSFGERLKKARDRKQARLLSGNKTPHE